MQDKATLEDALAIMRDLRARDAWDKAQTHDSLRPYLNEEMHELDDALRSGDDAAICGELGDVLLQVLFHAVIAEERGAFGPSEVAGSLVAKMRKRHPWLYGTDTERTPWEQMKSKARNSLAEGLPMGLPALHRAHRLQERAAGVGFDWPDVEGPMQKVAEELGEVKDQIVADGAACGATTTMTAFWIFSFPTDSIPGLRPTTCSGTTAMARSRQSRTRHPFWRRNSPPRPPGSTMTMTDFWTCLAIPGR
jgi:uncharacterized protein YabN with tetrapyrrole methylase and pyrophosphatase domain